MIELFHEDLRAMSVADLVALLDDIVPPRCVLPSETIEEAHRYAGKRDLIDCLKEALEV